MKKGRDAMSICKTVKITGGWFHDQKAECPFCGEDSTVSIPPSDHGASGDLIETEVCEHYREYDGRDSTMTFEGEEEELI